jgi:protein-disulfide isomerase
MVLGAGLWFVSLQLFALKTICPYCMTAHTCAMVAGALLLSQATSVLRRPAEGQAPPSRPLLQQRDLLLPIAMAAIAVAVLVTGQVLYRPKTYLSNPVVAGVVTNAPTVVARQFQIFDGQFQFQLNEVPLIGKLDAPHVMVSLFDYTCHHCRQVHPILMDAQRQFSNQLAIVSLPMPLDSHCNPRIRRTQPPHTNACALARIGLTVWSADHKKGGTFDDWIFAPETPPLPAAAETYARQLVGAEAFDKASTNSWVNEQLRRDIAIYEKNYQLFRKSAMPEAIIGTNLISGVFSRDQLLTMLSQQFGL